MNFTIFRHTSGAVIRDIVSVLRRRFPLLELDLLPVPVQGEGASEQIRVNVVNPDAVLRGSKIWTGEWKEQRAATYKTDDLEAHYRERSMLKLSVFPEDIAEAIYFLASDMSAKSTGNIVNVDAGNAQSFTR